MMADSVPPIDPAFASPSDFAAYYRAHGLQVVPAVYPMRGPGDKRPALASWAEFHNELVGERVFAGWFGQGAKPNMGIITGRCSGNVFVVDLDIYKSGAAALWWDDATGGIEPETWRQTTGGGGKQVLLRAPPGVVILNCNTSIGVDVRGQGGFAMLPPSQHLSGKEYAWDDGFAPWDCAIADAPADVLAAVLKLAAEHPGLGGHERTEAPASAFDAWGNLIDGREKALAAWVWRAVLELHRRTNGEVTEEAAKEAFEDCVDLWERHTRTRIQGADNAEGLEREGRGRSALLAKWRHAMKKWGDKVAEEAAKPSPKGEPLNGGVDAKTVVPGPASPLSFQSAFPIEGADIPVRDWIVPGLFLARHLSVLVAPPGSGKSLLTLQLAIACATGLSWGGWSVRRPCKVLVVNAEDDMDEMRRRLWAAAQSMGVPQAELTDRILLVEAPESIIVAKTEGKSKAVQRTTLVDQLVETIVANEIGVIMADPFAETFEGDENSNSEVKWAGIIWREIARRAEAAVLLVHHTKKYAGDMAGNADAARGASALVGTARIVSTLFAMTEEEASLMDVPADQRTLYVRFDDAKANMSLVTGIAKWFRKRSVPIPNGRLSLPGDDVGVLEPWTPPGLFEGVSVQIIGRILDTLDRGMLDDDGHPTGLFYTRSNNGKDKSRWAGTLIASMLGCDEVKAKQVLGVWIETGLLVEFEFHDGKQSRKGLRSDPTKRPDRCH